MIIFHYCIHNSTVLMGYEALKCSYVMFKLSRHFVLLFIFLILVFFEVICECKRVCIVVTQPHWGIGAKLGIGDENCMEFNKKMILLNVQLAFFSRDTSVMSVTVGCWFSLLCLVLCEQEVSNGNYQKLLVWHNWRLSFW
jgi:hypothetical protein